VGGEREREKEKERDYYCEYEREFSDVV